MITIYFSQLIGRAIKDSNGRQLGSLVDLAIIDGKESAEVWGMVVAQGADRYIIPIDQIDSFESSIYLAVKMEKISKLEVTEKEILDQYWDFWKSRMIQKFGLCHKDITQENCIDEWVVGNWAWEKTD